RSDCLRGGAGTRIGPDYRACQAHRPDVGPLHVNGSRIRAVSSSEARDQTIGSRLIASVQADLVISSWRCAWRRVVAAVLAVVDRDKVADDFVPCGLLSRGK